jgi:two-component system, OmpR family, response regulator ChvI
MDVRMPDLNGLELYCRLRSINPVVKVLFVSALGIAEEISSILPEVKSDDVIQKPVDKISYTKSKRHYAIIMRYYESKSR